MGLEIISLNTGNENTQDWRHANNVETDNKVGKTQLGLSL